MAGPKIATPRRKRAYKPTRNNVFLQNNYKLETKIDLELLELSNNSRVVKEMDDSLKTTPTKIVNKMLTLIREDTFDRDGVEGQIIERYLNKEKALFSHPLVSRAKLVTLPGGKRVYHVSSQDPFTGKKKTLYLKGVTTETVHKIFHPDTSENPIERSKRNKELGGRLDHQSAKVTANMKSPCNNHGAKHGTIAHHQVELITNRINAILSGEAKVDAHESTWWKMGQDLDPCVESFMNMLYEEMMLPRRAEFIVFDEELGRATAVDLIVLHLKKWKLCFIEMKFGYEGEKYETHENDTFFMPPLDNVPNSPLNRHLLQSLMTQMIAERNYVAPDASYLISIRPKMEIIAKYKHSDWCLQESNRQAIILAVKRLKMIEDSQSLVL